MANVQFKRGSHASLEALLAKNGTAGSFVEGAFYLTTDSDRLYFAQSDSELVHLNHNVIHVASVSELQKYWSTAVNGDFYYCAAENVLCTKNTAIDATKWIQINKNTDTDHDTKVTKLEGSAAATANTALVLTTTLTNSNYDLINDAQNPSSTSTIQGTVTITKAQLEDVLKHAVNVSATVAGNTVTVKTSGNGAGGTGFTITGAGNVSVGGTNNAIEIYGEEHEYGFSNAANSNTLTFNNDGSDETVVISAGNQISVTNATAGNIKIAHGSVSTSTNGNQTGASADVAHAGELKAITALTTNNGHVTGAVLTTYNLPEDEYVDTIEAGESGALNIVMKSGEEKPTAAHTISFTHTSKNDAGVVTSEVIDNKGTLDFYTTAQIDSKLRGLDAMTYKGTVNGTSGDNKLPVVSDGVRNGDAYKVTTAFGDYEVGDLLIAVGTESASTGLITTGLTWTRIPAGTDTNDAYLLQVSGTTVTLKNDTAGSEEGSVTFQGDSNEITVTGSGTNITIAHANHEGKKVTATKTTPAAGTIINVVTDVVATDKGHVDTYTVTPITLPNDNDTTYEVSAGSITGGASIVVTGGGEGAGSGSNSAVKVLSGTQMDVKYTDDETITVNHAAIQAPTKGTASQDLYASEGATKNSFQAISAITLNNGHVTGYTTKTYNMPDDNNSSYQLTGGVATATNGVTITHNLNEEGTAISGDTTVSTAITSESLKVSAASTTEVKVELEWGTF